MDFAPARALPGIPRATAARSSAHRGELFYDMPHTLFYYNYSSEPPWGESITITRSPGRLRRPLARVPGREPYPVSFTPSLVFPTAGYYETVPLDVKVTYLEQWNLSLQKQIGASWLLKASYMGNNTIHLWTDHEFNPAVYVPGKLRAGQYGLAAAGPCSTVSNTQARRRLTQLNPSQGPLYGTVELLDDGGTGKL